MIDAVRLSFSKSIKAIVMTCRAVGNVQRRAGVVEAIRIDDPVVDRSNSLIDMSTPADVQIHAVGMEENSQKPSDKEHRPSPKQTKYQPLWPKTTIHGVKARLTDARSSVNQVIC